MTASNGKIAPGPKGGLLLGNVTAFQKDPLGLIADSAREYGDVVRFRLGPQVAHLVNHPDHAAHVLQKNFDNYDKNSRSTRSIKRVCGESLLTSNGEVWRRQRKMVQPAFHHQSIKGFAELMAESCENMLNRWSDEPEVSTRDVSSEMMRLTYTIVARALFSADLSGDAGKIEPAMRILLDHTFERLSKIFAFPGWAPTPKNRQFHRALEDVDNTVTEIIEQHRSHSSEQNDLLSMLMGIRDEDTGEGLDELEIRNETVTLLISGHETTSNALTWTLHLLSKHPEIQDRLRGELLQTLDGRTPCLEDIPKLEFTTKVIQESMRLYPPIWIMERNVIEEDVIDGYLIPKGSSMVICPWTMHRHPAFWDEPEEFRPDRFGDSVNPAYMPFGAGQRFCIGNEFAMLEARIIIAMILQRYRVSPIPDARIEPMPGIALSPRYGLPIELQRLS